MSLYYDEMVLVGYNISYLFLTLPSHSPNNVAQSSVIEAHLCFDLNTYTSCIFWLASLVLRSWGWGLGPVEMSFEWLTFSHVQMATILHSVDMAYFLSFLLCSLLLKLVHHLLFSLEISSPVLFSPLMAKSHTSSDVTFLRPCKINIWSVLRASRGSFPTLFLLPN